MGVFPIRNSAQHVAFYHAALGSLETAGNPSGYRSFVSAAAPTSVGKQMKYAALLKGPDAAAWITENAKEWDRLKAKVLKSLLGVAHVY